MTITLDIKPEVQAELSRQAAVQDRPVEAVAAALLEDAVHLSPRTLRGLNIEFERDKDPGRDIHL